MGANPDSSGTAETIICVAAAIALLWSAIQFRTIAGIEIKAFGENEPLKHGKSTTVRLQEIYDAIYAGAESFLKAEYIICCQFCAFFGVVVLILTSWGNHKDGDQSSFGWTAGGYTTMCFLLGAITSMASGYIGMKVAVFSNVRTTISAQEPNWTSCFNTAFRAGASMGFALCGLGMILIYVSILIMRHTYTDMAGLQTLADCLTGYGLGGSCIAMFGRVGGGIYTKAADVGADLVGKVIVGIPEDDPRNPATIADNVGDNVGDVAGMGADLFGSFAESTCACLVIGAGVNWDIATWGDIAQENYYQAWLFPIAVSAVGVFVCIACSFIATDILPVRKEADVEMALKVQLISTTIVMLPAIYGLAVGVLPESFTLYGIADTIDVTPWKAFVCVGLGAVGGLIIGLVTEYFTSHSYAPVREVANSCKTGAATNIIYGMSLGFKSVVIPVTILSIIVYGSFTLGDLYGVSLAAIGMLSNLATGLTIDVYGPVCDNAGGIAEMAELDPQVREKTDALDAAGNTTAAIGKGFAIGSAALVSLALIGAFVSRVKASSAATCTDISSLSTCKIIFGNGVNMLEPLTFAFLIFGGMIPFWFAAMTMKSVGQAAMEMVREVQRQFKENPKLLDKDSDERPDYDACIGISTRASLREMVAPGAMVMFTPLITGTFFGVNAVVGLLVGALIASVQLAISMSNSGGAWDNAKKYVEKSGPGSELGGKGSDIHKAAVVGDTVGDPFKDTSGPALNIVMKLMAVLSLVFADYFFAIYDGRGLFQFPNYASIPVSGSYL